MTNTRTLTAEEQESFNRTFVELKFPQTARDDNRLLPFNRTFVELKYY